MTFEHHKPQYVRLHELLDFHRCKRLHFYKKILWLNPFEHIALKFGEAIHAGVGFLMDHCNDFEGGFLKFREIWQDRDQMGDEKRNSNVASLMLMTWMGRNQPGQNLYIPLPPPPSLLDPNAPIKTHADGEVPWAIDMGPGLPVLVGRIDRFIQHRDTGEKGIYELKTASRIYSSLLSGFDLSPQLIGYATAARTRGIPITFGMVEFLLVDKKKCEIELKPTIITEDMMDAFVEWSRYELSLMMELWDRQKWPREFAGCHPYSQFGIPGYPCDFQKLCMVKDWSLLAQTYEIREPEVPFSLQHAHSTGEYTDITVKGQTV